MKIGTQSVNGLFVYNSQLTYTESDIVLYTGLDSEGNQVSRLFYVISDSVTGVNPLDDINNVYYKDYFLYMYSINTSSEESQALTKNNVLTYLRRIFHGIGPNGIFTPEEIQLEEIGDIQNSGVYQVVDNGPEVIVYKGDSVAYMILISNVEFRFCKGTVSDNVISWDTISMDSGTELNFVDISTDANSAAALYLNKLNSLEVLLRRKISELHELVQGFPEVSVPGYYQVFNVNENE